jgi:hypothetical protein
MLGTWLVASNGLRSAAHADRPITFSRWVFKPDTVKDYVNFYNQKFGGQVKYEPFPWVQYHLSFAKTLSARLINLRSVWRLETLETATGPGVRVARGRPGGEKILGATQNDPEERCQQPA